MAIVTSHLPGAFCWIELGTTDQAAAKTFYGELFGWGFEDMPMGPNSYYSIFKLKGQDVAAGYTIDPERMPGVPPHWMVYIAVADADEAVRYAAELGAEVVMSAIDVFDKGRMAVLKDPTGGVHNVWQAKANTGIGIYSEPGAFCWGQLNTTDIAKAQTYYTKLFGWGAMTSGSGADAYTELIQAGVPIGGMMTLPPGVPSPSHWLAYFAVEDCDASAAKAVSLGATQCVPPTDIPGTGRFAVFSDPQGAFFAIYRG